jgi:integrase
MSARLTGHLRVEPRKSGRVWVAKYGLAEGGETRKVLGKAWVKDSGRKTARGAIVWRVADGPKPDEDYLAPKDAQVALDKILDEEMKKKKRSPRPVQRGRTFGEAVRAWLKYLKVDKGREETTINGHKSRANVLLEAFGDATLLHRVNSAERIDKFFSEIVHGERLSTKGQPYSQSTRYQLFVAMNGTMKLAKRRGWIEHNAMVDVEPMEQPKSSGEFQVLTPIEVEAVARAVAEDWSPVVAGPRNRTSITEAHAKRLTLQLRWCAMHWAACIRLAAYTGLRMGELRALRWKHIDFNNAVIRIQRNAPASLPSARFAESGGKAPKSGLVGSLPLIPQAAAMLEKLAGRRLDPDDESAPVAYGEANDFVFPSFEGRMADLEPARDAFYRALDIVGLGHLREEDPAIRFHDLRHTFGTLAVRKFPLSDVQRMMRHKDISTTMKYTHYVPRPDDAARLGEAFAAELSDLAQLTSELDRAAA